MLHRRSLRRFILISLALMGMSVSSANAVSINIDFGNIYPSPDAYGAASGQTGHWNQISSFETTDLLDLKGVKTDVDLSLSGSKVNLTGNAGTPGNSNARLLNDFFFTSLNEADWSLKILNLDAGKYDVYYYAPPNGNVKTGAFSINGTDVANLPGVENKKDPVLEQGKNWDVLKGVSLVKDVALGSLVLLLDFPAVNAIEPETTHYGLSALQIVSVPSPIPVPTAVWLFGTALIGMIGFGRRRKAA